LKVSAVITRPTISLDNTKKSAILSSLVIVAGLVAGSVIYLLCSEDFTNNLFDYLISFATDFSNKNKPEILSGLVLQNLIYYIAMLIFGTSVIGTPAVLFISFIKAVGLSFLTTYIYGVFALKGIEYCLLVVFPGKFFLLFAMVLLTQNCYCTSTEIIKSLRGNDSRGVNFKKFSVRSLLILLILLIASTIDFLMIISFSSLFDFS
jgi:hypothetical protein